MTATTITLVAMKNLYATFSLFLPCLWETDQSLQLKHYKLPIIAGKDSPKVTKTPAHGSTFTIGEGIKVKALHTPCHTQDSICYFFEDGNQRAVFTGDTLFIGGCGRFFEGAPEEMHKALNKTLAELPDDTKVYVRSLCAPDNWK
jgi:glyoxylase-like metal-dependent hydrolase (beta-lactamase superfamily II)